MTIGQRIQALRKERGLSQEALGEAMGVSRQAISKWESDLTLPELDKLIALSKFFDLPLGQLLGVEEAGTEAPIPDRLSPREEAMVQAIAQGYFHQNQASQHRRDRLGLMIGAMAGVILLCGLLLVGSLMNSRLEEMGDRINSLEHRLNGVLSDVDSRLNAAANSLSSMLENQADLVESWDYTLEGMDEEGNILLSYTLVPKEYTQGDRADITFLADGEEVTAPGEWDGQAFRFQAAVPPAETLQPRLSLTTGEVQRSQNLQAIFDLPYETQLNVQAEGRRTSTHNRYSKEWKGTATPSWIITRKMNALDLHPTDLRLVWTKNGEILEEENIPIKVIEHQMQEAPSSVSTWSMGTTWEKRVPLAEEGEYVLYYQVTDNLGRIYREEFIHIRLDGKTVEDLPMEAPWSMWQWSEP